eukprot:12030491-Karenia_brevis.AAC.1
MQKLQRAAVTTGCNAISFSTAISACVSGKKRKLSLAATRSASAQPSLRKSTAASSEERRHEHHWR